MPEIEAYAAVRDFVETGGDVLLAIAVVTFGMWLLILERYWFFSWVHPKAADRVQEEWDARQDHQSWFAHKIRLLLLTDVDIELQRGLQIIKSEERHHTDMGCCRPIGLSPSRITTTPPT